MTDPYLVPPPVGTPYPSNIPIGTVILYEESKWTSPSVTVTTGAAVEGKQYSLPTLSDKTTWVAFNLPAGVVMTLTEDWEPEVAGQPYNFKGRGVCVDLIGNGQVQTVDLKQCAANDCITAYVWRQVDLDGGIFQLFEKDDYTGGRNTFFLSEWSFDSVQSLAGWWISEKTSSVYFCGLTAESFTLYEGGNGDGRYVSYAGWLSIYEVGSLGGFNDKCQSWSWSLLTPLYSTTEPFTLSIPVKNDPTLSISSKIAGSNLGTSTIVDKLTVISAESQSLTLSVTDSVTIGNVENVKFTFSVNEGVSTQTAEISCSFSQNYTETDTKTTVVTRTITLTVEQDVSIPANSDYQSSLTIQFAKVNPTAFSTTGKFYYDEPVPGSTLDPTITAEMGRNIYVLSQSVTGTIGGGIASQVTSSTVTTAIEGGTAPSTVRVRIPVTSG